MKKSVQSLSQYYVVCKSILLQTLEIRIKGVRKSMQQDLYGRLFIVHEFTNEGRMMKMSVYGYHRTSTTEQHLDRGLKEITEFCQKNGYKLERIYTDQQTGKNFNRPRYTVLRDDILRDGDILIITEVDRLGRNKKDTLDELRILTDRNIRVMILEIPTTLQNVSAMNNSMAKMVLETINHMLIELYAAMAQAEVEKKEKRQREGIEAKKLRGEWDDYGRPKIQKPDNWEQVIERWRAKQITAVEAMKQMGLKKSSFYKLLKLK